MRIVLAGGGTGGHLMPGVAMAQRIKREDPEAHVLFIAGDREMEIRTLNRYGLEARHTTARPLTMNPATWPAFVSGGLKVLRQSYRTIAEFGPDVALGLGGNASFFPLIAARLQRIPIVLLEQNVIPGKVTRRLAPFAEEVACQWPESIRHFGVKVKARITGNPIREEILAATREEAIERLHLDQGKKTLLVTGGSQGAHPLNEMMIACAGKLASRAPELQVIHLSGRSDHEAVGRAYQQAGIGAETAQFLDDVALAYAAADLAISRAGGTTIAELTVHGVPCILVPYPHATDNHQLHNARALAGAGAAMVLEQSQFTPERLVGMICDIINNPGLTKRMHTACTAVGRPDAADEVLRTLHGCACIQVTNDAIEALRPEQPVKEHT